MRKIFSSKSFVLIIFIIIIAFLAFLNFKGFLDKPKNAVYGFFLPVQKLFYQIGKKTSDNAGAILSLSKIISQNQSLKEQNLKLQVDLSQMEEVSRENKSLKGQLNLPSSEKFNSVLANVVGYDPVNFGQSIFIDKGLTAGIKADMPVVTPAGILIGRVAEAFQSTAKVQLLTDSNSAINIITQTSRSTGILKGDGGRGLTMDMIPQDKNIEAGENVITSGLGGIFPKGLLVGQIGKIISSDSEVFKKAQIKPAADIMNLGVVLAITEK